MRGNQVPKGEPVFCLRCGRIGHQTEDCDQNLPTIEQMRVSIDSKTRGAVMDSPKNWVNDEYGLYLQTERSISTEKTFKDGVFCFNCGCFGHTPEECPEPTFDTLYGMFKPYLNDHGVRASQKKKEIIKSINKFCKKVNKPIQIEKQEQPKSETKGETNDNQKVESGNESYDYEEDDKYYDDFDD